MVQGHHQRAVPVKELAVLLADLEVRLDQLHGADAAQTHDDLGLHQPHLGPEIAPAGILLRVQGIPVLRRTALDGVGDIDILPVQADHGQHVVQQLAAPAHKGLALQILVGAGRLADEQHLGVGVAHAEHHLGTGLPQLARLTFQTGLSQFLPRGHFTLASIQFQIVSYTSVRCAFSFSSSCRSPGYSFSVQSATPAWRNA